jgi:hypothetical protein
MVDANEVRILIEVGRREEISESISMFVPVISEVVSFRRPEGERLRLVDVSKIIPSLLASALERCNRILIRWRAYEDRPLMGQGDKDK